MACHIAVDLAGAERRPRRGSGRWRRGALVLAGAAVLSGAGTAAVAARLTGPVLVFSPSPYDYGQVSPGQSASQAFILSNSGQRATGRLRVRLSGPAAFSITGSTCRAARLRPGGACTITVRFAPSRAGRITATLTAASKGGPQHAATAADVLAGGRVLGAAPGQIYWVSQDEIWAANLDGTSPHAILTGQDGPEGIAVDSSHLYWADDGDGTIWEANLDGTSPHIIFTGQRGLAAWPSRPVISTGPTTVAPGTGPAPSGPPTWTAATRTPSSPGRLSRTEWRPTPAMSTGPTKV